MPKKRSSVAKAWGASECFCEGASRVERRENKMGMAKEIRLSRCKCKGVKKNNPRMLIHYMDWID